MAYSFQCESGHELKFHTEDSAERAVSRVDTRVLPVTVCCCMDIGNALIQFLTGCHGESTADFRSVMNIYPST